MPTSIVVPLGNTRALDAQGVGTIFYSAVLNKWFKWVQYILGAHAAAAAGDALAYHATSNTGLTKVSSDESACIQNLGAGAVPNETGYTLPANEEYFWMQVKGIITLSTTVGNTPGAGKTIGMAAGTDAVFDATPAAGTQSCGYMINATTLVFLDCPY